VPLSLPRSKKLRTALLVVGSLVFVAIVAAILVATADSGGKETPAAKAKAKAKQQAAAAKQGTTKLKVGTVAVENTGYPTAVKLSDKRAVMSATQRYFNYAIQDPLRHGRINNAYSKVFDRGIRGLAAGKDRATLTEATTGPIRGPVTIHAARVRIDGLGDPTGTLALIATTFAVKVDTATPTGKLTIRRHTELTFALEKDGWIVTAYRVTVRRSIAGKTTTTTARGGPGPTI
jgi:hypothetical protein